MSLMISNVGWWWLNEDAINQHREKNDEIT